MSDKKFHNRKKIIPVDPSNNVFDVVNHDGSPDGNLGFFRLEIKSNGNLYCIMPDGAGNPLHINQSGELILTI